MLPIYALVSRVNPHGMVPLALAPGLSSLSLISCKYHRMRGTCNDYDPYQSITATHSHHRSTRGGGVQTCSILEYIYI